MTFITTDCLEHGGDTFKCKNSNVIAPPESNDITVVKALLKKHSLLPQPKGKRIIHQ